MLTIKSTPGLTFGPIKEFVVLNFFFLCSLNVVFVLVKLGFCYLSREGQKYIIKAFAMQKILHHSFI